MSLPNLPVETWHKILDETISIPAFLEAKFLPEVTNPLYVAPINYDSVYWEMEGRRKCLQLVCKSWETYLGSLAHRYVRIADFLHGELSADVVCRAIRILYGPCGARKCRYCHLGEVFSHLPVLLEKSAAQAGSSLSKIRVEIIEVTGMAERYLLPMLLKRQGYRMMPGLKVIIGMKVDKAFRESEESEDNSQWTRMMNLLPDLQFIDVTNPENKLYAFRANNLTTLSYHSYVFSSLPTRAISWGLPSLDQYSDALPSLRHLRLPSLLIPYDAPSHQLVKELIRLLTAIGSGLLSLQIGREPMHQMIMVPQIWDLCPKLKRLDSGFRFPSPPPPNHPITTISTFIPQLGVPINGNGMNLNQNFGSNEPTETYLSFFPPSLVKHWPYLKRLIVRGPNGGWDDIRQRIVQDGSEVRDWLVDLVGECRRYNIGLEDQEGVLFEGAGIYELLNYDSRM